MNFILALIMLQDEILSQDLFITLHQGSRKEAWWSCCAAEHQRLKQSRVYRVRNHNGEWIDAAEPDGWLLM
jgi:hypothetical protein